MLLAILETTGNALDLFQTRTCKQFLEYKQGGLNNAFIEPAHFIYEERLVFQN